MGIPKSLKEKIKFVPKEFRKWYDTTKCRSAISKNGEMIGEAKNQTRLLQLAAIRDDVDALAYIRNQTEEICLEAVSISGYSLRFVRNQTPEICRNSCANRRCYQTP